MTSAAFAVRAYAELILAAQLKDVANLSNFRAICSLVMAEGEKWRVMSDKKDFAFLLSLIACHHQAFSSPAYFSMSFFWPKPGKLTVSLAESPAPSRRRTRPRPYLGWRTCEPGANAPAAFDEDDAEGDEAGPLLPPADAARRLGSGAGGLPVRPANFSPRCRKNSAMESTLS
jgi:hypothetical protein